MIASIFKAYDIRGIYPKELNEKTAQKIGNAFAQICQADKIIIGRDIRLSSDSLFKALSKGITMAGIDVLDIGLVSTDAVLYASGVLNLPAVMITASHNPKQYNGFKISYAGAKALDGQTGLAKILKLIQQQKEIVEQIKGEVQTGNIIDLYTKALHQLINPKKIKPLRIAVDAGNGMAGKILPEVYKKLPVKITPLYFKLDGNFPNHQPNPIERKNTVNLRKKIITAKANFGMAFDGDGDRIFFFDEKGKSISATIIGALIADYILSKPRGRGKSSKEKILYNAVCGRILPETIKKHGAQAIKDRVGHTYIKKTMRAKNIVFGAEASGHYFYRDLFFIDSAMMTALIVTQIISEAGKKFSEVIKPYQKYFAIEETNSAVKNPQKIISKLKQQYSDGQQSKLDGLTVEYPDWWFNVRPSNTEPLLRLNLEANTKQLMQTKKKELLKIIK